MTVGIKMLISLCLIIAGVLLMQYPIEPTIRPDEKHANRDRVIGESSGPQEDESGDVIGFWRRVAWADGFIAFENWRAEIKNGRPIFVLRGPSAVELRKLRP